MVIVIAGSVGSQLTKQDTADLVGFQMFITSPAQPIYGYPAWSQCCSTPTLFNHQLQFYPITTSLSNFNHWWTLNTFNWGNRFWFLDTRCYQVGGAFISCLFRGESVILRSPIKMAPGSRAVYKFLTVVCQISYSDVIKPYRWFSARLQYLHWRYCNLALNNRYELNLKQTSFQLWAHKQFTNHAAVALLAGHCNDVITGEMGTMASQITSLTIVYSTVYSPGTGEFPHKWPVTRKMFPFDDVIMARDNGFVSKLSFAQSCSRNMFICMRR